MVDPVTHSVTLAGKQIDLPRREFDLLHALALQPGRVFTVDELLGTVWGAEFIGQPQVVYVHIRWLRKKLREVANHPRRIVTVRGVGYKLDSGGSLMFRSLRSRLVLSHALPLLVIIPIIGVALTNLIETRVLLPSLSKALMTNAVLLANVAGDEAELWANPAYAEYYLTHLRHDISARVQFITPGGQLLASSDPDRCTIDRYRPRYCRGSTSARWSGGKLHLLQHLLTFRGD